MSATSSILHRGPTGSCPPSSPPHASAKSDKGNGPSFAFQVADLSSGASPAKAARAALETRTDLADRPFGQIVSLLAHHEELSAAADPAPEPSASSDESVDAGSDDTSSEPV